MRSALAAFLSASLLTACADKPSVKSVPGTTVEKGAVTSSQVAEMPGPSAPAPPAPEAEAEYAAAPAKEDSLVTDEKAKVPMAVRPSPSSSPTVKNIGDKASSMNVAVGGSSGMASKRGAGAAIGKTAIGSPRDAVSSEDYKDWGKNAWTDVERDKLSTFAVDVDTAAYTIARRKLQEGSLPPTASVRVEEFVNFFKYAYDTSQVTGDRPFAVTMDAAPSPFAKDRHFLRVGVATKHKDAAERKPANLVFLVDVSGSMQSADKLDLAKRALRILVDNLSDKDSVSLVTYAGSTRVVLEPTRMGKKALILSAVEDLTAGGSTAMASGLDLAYQMAERGNNGSSVSRVIVLSDGDANVGTSSHEEILKNISGHVKEGVTLSTIGFGMGNYKDQLMEQLADKGNGNNFYIDSLSEAKRIFAEQLGSTLEVVAKDVKIQVEFDATKVKQYRLVGYENRNIADQDFRNDAVDAGEIGAGHQVTAVYEIELTKAGLASPQGLATTRVRHKMPRGNVAAEAAFAFDATKLSASWDSAASDTRFAVAVAAFADVLRGGKDAQTWDLRNIQKLANQAAGSEESRSELVSLVAKASQLRGGNVLAQP